MTLSAILVSDNDDLTPLAPEMHLLFTGWEGDSTGEARQPVFDLSD